MPGMGEVRWRGGGKQKKDRVGEIEEERNGGRGGERERGREKGRKEREVHIHKTVEVERETRLAPTLLQGRAPLEAVSGEGG